MKIKDIPYWNRPSHRIKDKELNPAELLSLIIWSGKKGENAIDVSNRLLKKYSFLKLSRLSLSELQKEVGKIAGSRLKAMFEIFKITSKLGKNGFKPTIECAEDVYNYFSDFLKDKKREHLYALLLDSKNRIIKEELISVGTLNSTLVHPREVFKEAIRCSANSLILVHNHPSGDSKPSDEDIEVYEKILKAGNTLNIKVLDSIVVGDGFESLK